MSSDFLSENNNCGQAILRLVSRGNAIIAELLRLSEFVPVEFSPGPDTPKEERDRLELLLPDFSYFQKPDLCEARIDQNASMQNRDEELRENMIDILTRFYLVFESVYKYVIDLQRYLEELEEGVFVQQTLESVLMNADGKQLMAEALFLYGVMLLIIEDKYEAIVRERIMVSYYRYSSSKANVDNNIDDVCKLLRTTGYIKHQGGGYVRPKNYPESYFARIAISEEFVDMIIGRLRSDDIYNQIQSYPSPDQRSVALATQAAMLYVILYFQPSLLHSQQAKMREIVDKHFPDNWVISIYMGMSVNLIEAWEPYKAAKTALNNTLEASNLQEQAVNQTRRLERTNKQVLKYLSEGALVEEFVLDNIPRLMSCLRDCNVTIRWLMLHTALTPECEPAGRCRKVREQLILDCKYDPLRVFELLLNTAQFEFVLSEMFKRLLDMKQHNWLIDKDECSSRLRELAEVFSGDKPLTRVERNDNLQAWFGEMANQIDNLDYDDSTSAGRKIIQLIQAMEEVLEFHQLEQNLQVKQFLEDVQRYLKHMLRTINIKEETLVVLKIVSDLSYAWIIIDTYTPFMQEGIKNNPQLVIKLRATFLKLATALDLPLVRILQANSSDLQSVSKYYSSELVSYVRKVLQIIPESMFLKLAEIIQLQTDRIKEVPTRLDKDKIREFSQLNDRYQVAELTHSISVFTVGILMMKTTLVGIIKVDPKQLLEDGIRKELVNKVARALHYGLVFNYRSKVSELEPKLKSLASEMSGFLRSFEYIQDYVDIYGLRIWQQEVSRIINYNVEQECNRYLRKKVMDWESIYQSTTIPIPRFRQLDGESYNFIGRLAREIIRITDFKHTCYVPQMRIWYDKKTHAEIVGVGLWGRLLESVDTFGLNGLDRLYCFMIVRELQQLHALITRKMLEDKALVSLVGSLAKPLKEGRATLTDATKVYNLVISRTSKYWSQVAEHVIRVGQIQLIRRQIAHELRAAGKFDSKLLMSCLENFNNLLLSDIQAHYKDPTKPYPGDNNPLMFELATYLEAAGLHDPSTKIYIATTQHINISLIKFLLLYTQLSKLTYFRKIGGLVAKKQSEAIDGPPFITGMVTLLRQFHSDVTDEFLQYTCQYIRSLLYEDTSKERVGDVTDDIVVALTFMDDFMRTAGLSRDKVLNSIPTYLFDEFRTLAI